MTAEVHISSLVVQAKPDRLDEIADAILSRGAEIPARDPNGKLVVVLETESEATISDFLNEVAVMSGVLSANLVFHQVDNQEAGPSDGTPFPGGEA